MPEATTPTAARPAVSDRASLTVSVLVDLQYRPGAGGHVKVWERLAAAAIGLDGLDLTVHFAAGGVRGAAPGTRALGDNVRFRFHPPVFSTAQLPFLSHVPDHTDLAPHHRELARHLTGADVLHTTDAYFAFARTAERVARRRGIPLVNSVHTDTPRYTSLFTAQTIERLLVWNPLSRVLVDRVGLPRLAKARMQRRLLQHQRRCAAALLSRPEDVETLARTLSPGRVGLLRRGIDRDLFSPTRRDRAWLDATFGVPPERLVILFVGRLDRGKNVSTLVEAVRGLVDAGRPLHLLCAGEGPERASIQARLGPAVSCPGVLAPEDLCRAYASADVVAHPSQIEQSSNVVIEALACGRPLLAAESGGAGRLLIDGETGIVVRGGESTSAWMEALSAVSDNTELRARLGSAARLWVERAVPTWRDVLAQDLVPVWRRARAPAPPGAGA